MLVSILVDNVKNPSLCLNSAMLANAHAKVKTPNSAHLTLRLPVIFSGPADFTETNVQIVKSSVNFV